MADLIDLTGQRFGKLTVIERTTNSPRGLARWVCQCDCGNTSIVRTGDLQIGHSKSCGCARGQGRWVANQTAGHVQHPLYKVWTAMKMRCLNTNYPTYHYYGGRGVTVCERWRDSFQAFLKDVGERPPDPKGWTSRKAYWSLDRIDPNGDYEPTNVRWATPSQQSNNRRRSRHVDMDEDKGK